MRKEGKEERISYLNEVEETQLSPRQGKMKTVHTVLSMKMKDTARTAQVWRTNTRASARLGLQETDHVYTAH